MSPYEHEREHYRVVYPVAARPRFLSEGWARDVVDLCESGLRYRLAEGEHRALGDTIAGVVHLRRGGEVRVSGAVVRIADREVAVHLNDGIPLRVVLEEQRYLRERHRGSPG